MNSVTVWQISKLLENPDSNVKIYGSPKIIDSKFGKAVLFDGEKDGIFISQNPIHELKTFTIEAIFSPSTDGPFEQRFLHFGHAQSNRLLLELRNTPQQKWYLDSFVKCDEASCVLIDEALQHNSGEWYHAAFVIDNGKLSSFVNGVKELEGSVDFSNVNDGITSIGVRQNFVSWFKGAIYKIIVTPKALAPGEFNHN